MLVTMPVNRRRSVRTARLSAIPCSTRRLCGNRGFDAFEPLVYSVFSHCRGPFAMMVRDAVTATTRDGVSLLLRLLRDIVYMPIVWDGRKRNGAIPDDFRPRASGPHQTSRLDLRPGGRAPRVDPRRAEQANVGRAQG